MGRRKKIETPQLDLHGVRHADVEQTVEDFILLKTPPVRIITGNSKTMQELVIKALDKHGYKHNDMVPACIIVTSE